MGYDISALLKNEMFLPLKNPGFFRNVQVETGGYAVFWNEEIDISEYELWTHGKDSIDKAITAAQALITEAAAQNQAVLEKYLVFIGECHANHRRTG